MLIDDYKDIKEFAFIPDKAINSYRELTQNNDSSYVVRNIINKPELFIVA